MKNNLTERQESILDFIRLFIHDTGYPPSLREIGKNFGISSTFGVKRHIDALIKKGYLKVESNTSRGITVINNRKTEKNKNISDNSYKEIPIVGNVAAGYPLLAFENIEGSIVVDQSFYNKNDEKTFALKVKGESMIDVGIYEDDLILISKQNNVRNGDIVVASLDDEITVKKYYQNGNKITLIPENKDFNIIEVKNEQKFSIIGKVKGVLRWIK